MIPVLLLLLSVFTFAQSVGPYASAKEVPKIWYALHSQYLTDSERSFVDAATTIVQVVPPPVTTGTPTVSFSPQGS